MCLSVRIQITLKLRHNSYLSVSYWSSIMSFILKMGPAKQFGMWVKTCMHVEYNTVSVSRAVSASDAEPQRADRRQQRKQPRRQQQVYGLLGNQLIASTVTDTLTLMVTMSATMYIFTNTTVTLSSSPASLLRRHQNDASLYCGRRLRRDGCRDNSGDGA